MDIISNAEIILSDSYQGRYKSEVWGTVKDERVLVLRYYEDELSFTPEEINGLTLREADELFRKKDVAYLQS